MIWGVVGAVFVVSITTITTIRTDTEAQIQNSIVIAYKTTLKDQKGRKKGHNFESLGPLFIWLSDISIMNHSNTLNFSLNWHTKKSERVRPSSFPLLEYFQIFRKQILLSKKPDLIFKTPPILPLLPVGLTTLWQCQCFLRL